MRFMSKKGISPLIASILLIGFTVALAAIVITWGSGFVQSITSSTEERTTKAIACTSDLNFEILKVTCNTNPGDPNAGVSQVLIDNKGSVDIKGLALRFFNANGDNTGVTNTVPILSFEIKTIDLFPGTIPQKLIPTGTIKVEALATIQTDGTNATCSEASRVKTFTPAC